MHSPLVHHTSNVIMYNGGKTQHVSNPVTSDILLTIFYNKVKLVTLNCSPCDLQKLSAGYLYHRGIIKTPGDISDIDCREVPGETEKTYRYYIYFRGKAAAVSKPPEELLHELQSVDSATKYSAQYLLQLINELDNHSAAFRITGGVHSTALAANSDLLAIFEDIGRHNAVDKVLGHLFLANIPPKDKCLLLTGRIAPEIVSKAAFAGIPLVVSRAAPTRLAIEQGEQLGITLVGFARGQKMYIFTNAERVIL